MKKVILITGASSGIGKGTALFFARSGWQVAATMRNPSKEIELQKNDNIKLYVLDVTKPESVKQAFAAVMTDFQQIDVLLNNAGYGLAGPLEPASEEKIKEQFETNLFGSMRTIQAATPIFRKQGRGMIINVTSVGGLVGLPFNSIYHATKFGLDGLSESLKYELAPFNIQVKVVAPGGVSTDFASRSLHLTTNEGEPTVYDPYITKVFERFQSNRANYSTAEQIAEVIYEAATDGKDQLRYIAGIDANRIYDAWKQMSNENFFKMVQQNFNLHQ